MNEKKPSARLILLKFGIVSGTTIGLFLSAWMTGGHDYFAHRFYRTALRIFAVQTDVSAMACVVLWVALIPWLSRRIGSGLLSDEWIERQRRLQMALCSLFVVFVFALMAVNIAAVVVDLHARQVAEGKPNIILVMIDTLRADHLGCYGYGHGTTLNIDRFASESTRYDRAIAQAPFTFWSVGSFMTSRFPQEVLPGHVTDTMLSARHRTLAETLKEHGYATMAVVSNPSVRGKSGFSRGFDIYDESNASLTISSPGVQSKCLSLLQRTRDRPFFLFALFMDPHAPYFLHDGELQGEDAGSMPFLMPGVSDCADTGTMRRYYDSEVKFTDRYVGQLLDALKKMDLYDGSLVVLLSDHGEEFMEHGGTFHGFTLYDEALSVPLIVKYPHQNGGCSVDSTTSLLSLFPTLAGCVDIDVSALDLRGGSLPIDDSSEVPEECAYSATNFADLISVSNSDYKYIRGLDASQGSLFDLKRDPGEHHDVLRKYPQAASGLERMLATLEESWRLSYGMIPPRHGRVLNDVEEDRLRSLGYLQ